MLNSDNEIIVSEDTLVELLLQGKQTYMATMQNTIPIERYNHFCSLFLIDDTIDVETPSNGSDKYNKELVENWFMPDEYKTYPVYDFCLKQCDTIEKKQRLSAEFGEFDERGLLPLLKYMKYFVDQMNENNIVMGVGRGSSVASYVLYLLGVHKIDSIKYNLDYKEFFR
jgi:DNA polymerase III alpha subunit|tara:strand:- start:4039 stop:4545 length:507 start_codon:yes stop_codon:yes gene_type:complete